VVVIASPPPQRRPRPLFRTLATGTSFLRAFRPTDHGASATSFRYFGPLLRFDHQRGQGALDQPSLDRERGIYYAAPTLSGCIVEIFGDIGVIECNDWHVAMVQITRDLHLLDLRGRGSMRAGTVAALAKEASRPLTQAWSRCFYEQVATYTTVDGLVYFNAHDDETAFALYERCADTFHCPTSSVRRLDHPALRPHLLVIADRHNLILA
jgi:hypothetical protein